ncbi:N2,N2-dimethylguanosine tRNA methyltransferase-domain-containing protein [Gaertneriomyces semiglobifer]|nr:N2,N2-dimethylguanosine tRNA methyltransferase-domain-containing protein [Gaertneriomyces semiglobifer]
MPFLVPVIAATDATSRPLAQIKITYEDHTKSFGEEDLEEPNWESDELKDWNFAILEALSATGLRSIRYAKDIPRLRHIIANDLLDDAVEAIKRNAEDNGVAGIVQPNKGDASAVMYQAIGTGFDVIDLDPYGSATQFLDGAVQAVAEGGLLCITCTDLAVLAGSQADACFAKYGAMSLPNSPFCHELALRILLHSTQQAASRYKRVIVPMLSLSIDFYVRVFVRVFTSPGLVKRVAGKTSMVYQCTGCRSFVTHPLGKSPEHGDGNKIGPITGPPVNNKCEHCNRPFHTAGPFWSAPIHNAEFVHRMLKHVKSTDASTYGTKARMTGMLSVVSEELPVPLYYNIATLSSTVHTQSLPILKIMSALLNMGYKASLTHASTNCIKTDASPQALWDIIRAWVKLNPVKNIKEEAPAGYILKQDSKHTVSFDLHPNADPPSRKIKLVRHQNNPTKYWGPMVR